MKKVLLPLLIISLLASCAKDDSETVQSIKNNYADIVYTGYLDSYNKAVVMQDKVNEFLASPDQNKFDAIKTAWLDARNYYGQTEGFRFYGGPIDDADGPEGLINAWPLDEGYIDYISGYPNSGVINDTVNYPVISATLLEGLNEQGGEANISTGWHAIEFLLWGQDLNSAGPGNRSYTDYTTAPNASRRGLYLTIVTDLLVQNLDYLVSEWEPNQNNYRRTFLDLDRDIAVSYILQGIGFLANGELAGERLSVAYDSQLQEDEHSCFSDNTHKDVQMNMLSIYNIYTGTYSSAGGSQLSGTSIADLIREKDAALADGLDALMNDCVTACNDIQSPFDQEILASNPEGRTRVLLAITNLRELGEKLSEAAGVLGVNITIE